MATNRVIAGDYINKMVIVVDVPYIAVKPLKISTHIPIDKTTVESYEVLMQDSNTSAASGIARSAVGGALFGSAGALGGAASAKTNDDYMIAINFKDGKRSLIDVDERTYKALIVACF